MNRTGRVNQLVWSLPVTLIVGALAFLPVAAQEGNVKDSPLFKGVKDPKVIASQIRTALPAYERGLALLNSSPDADTTAAAVRFLLDAYRYLRGAWHGNQKILITSKFPDPLVELQNKQIFEVRQGLLYCTGHREHLVSETRARCMDGLVRGLRTLRVLVVSLP